MINFLLGLIALPAIAAIVYYAAMAIRCYKSAIDFTGDSSSIYDFVSHFKLAWKFESMGFRRVDD